MASLYLVLDLINDIVAGQGAVAGEVQRRDILTHSATALAKARAAGVLVGYVRVGFTGEQDKPRFSPFLKPFYDAGYLRLDAAGTQVHPGVAPHPGDLDIVKHRVSAFWGTPLDMILRSHGIDRLYVSGVSTTYAVSSTVREAHDRDLDIVLIEDACAASDQSEHETSIASLMPLCGLVTCSAEIDFV